MERCDCKTNMDCLDQRGEKPDNQTCGGHHPVITTKALVVNQCDGCCAGIPAVNGVHRMGKPGGYSDLMGCTKDRYL